MMMLLGLTMRLAQAQWIHVQPDFFYMVMTMHGAGMVGIAGLSSAAVMWHFVRSHVPVSTAVFITNLVFFLIGAVLILGAGFIGGFGAAWTFLFPLPAHSMALWSVNAAAAYLVGLIFIGVGFLLLHLDIARGILSTYGGLGAALGIKQAFGLAPGEDGPPPAVTASTMALIANILGILVGAAVLIISLVNLYVPSFTFNALAAKNLIYYFGHTFINVTIYMAVIAVYEILPLYTHRKWKTNWAFYLAWVLSTVFVLTVYTHHLLMDFAMPTWTLVAGQIISWLSGLPVLLVTAFGTLTVVYRSGSHGIRRRPWSSSVWPAGSIGVIPAIADGTIAVNAVMHNTQWVPGHFHTYLLLGMVAMLLGFMTYLTQPAAALRLCRLGYLALPARWRRVRAGFPCSPAAPAYRAATLCTSRMAALRPDWIDRREFAIVGVLILMCGSSLCYRRRKCGDLSG